MTRTVSKRQMVSYFAIAAGLVASQAPAADKGFLGTWVVNSGDVGISESTDTTSIFVNSSQAVIDWTPDDNATGSANPITFLDSNGTANFQGFTDFAVLNRINVADSGRQILLNGSINSIVANSTGGRIYFYSPSGFLVGSSAAINVGSLVLSASPIAVTDGSFINNGVVTFGAANPTAAIATAAGSQINAFGTGSYVALVAPQISHSGIIRTDTAAALVAAEAATITFSPDGLFNIEVTTGTDAATGIDINGGKIERRSLAEGIDGPGNHHAYLVAVAKNDAVDMLIRNGGAVGFDTATSAAVEDNVVVLSGGYDIGFNPFGPTPDVPDFTQSGVSSVSLSITNASLSSDVLGQVSGGLDIDSSAGAVSLGGDLTFTAGGNALIDAMAGNLLSIAGNIDIQAYTQLADGSTDGTLVRLGAEGGSELRIGGNVSLAADSQGTHAQFSGENGGNAVGGDTQLIANNGTINIGGSLDLRANALGGFVVGNATGGTGRGGNISLLANNGGSVTVTGSVNATAEGQGGSIIECLSCGVTGGNGIGGSITVLANLGAPGTLNFNSDINLSANGLGGSGDVAGGSGEGGFTSLGAADGSTVNVLADAEVEALGSGGFTFTGLAGNGVGGEARISTNGGTVNLFGPAFVNADGEAGGSSGGTSGIGTGGQAYIAAAGGMVHARNNVVITALSSGGDSLRIGGGGGDGIANVSGTDATHAYLYAEGGTIIVGGLTVVSADAMGGDGRSFSGDNGGDAVAGFASIHANNSDAGPSLIQLGDAVVTADATGGNGGSGQSGTDGGNGGNGGSATGGRVVMTAAAGNGELTADVAIVSASATGGDGGEGGNGDGGAGGNGGDGGSAIGGWINIGTESGTAVALGSNDGSASFDSIVSLTTATGGDGGSFAFGSPNGIAGDGGDAIGGQNVLLVRGSLLTVGSVNLDASAFGGNGGLDANDAFEGLGGGAVTGMVGVLVTGREDMPAQRGTLDAGGIIGTAFATGGNGLTSGAQWTQGGSSFEVVNSDATIGNVSITVTADGLDPNAIEIFSNPIVVIDGEVTIDGGFGFATPGRVSVHADNGSLNAGIFNVSADNFVHDESRDLPASVGTIGANTFNLLTGQDLIVDAHLNSTSSLDLTAPGLIDIEDATSGGDLTLTAGGSLSGGSIAADGLVDAFAHGNIGFTSVNAGSTITINSGGDVGIANANSGESITIWAGSISTGNLTAQTSVKLDGGTITVSGLIDAGTDISITSLSGPITASAMNAGGNILLKGATAFSPGGIVFLLSSGAKINVTAGNLTAGGSVIANALGDITLGTVSAGTNVNIYSFDRGVVTGDIFAGGSIFLAGGRDFFGHGSNPTGITSGNLTAAGSIQADSRASILTGAVTSSGANVLLVARENISTGAINAASDVEIEALGNINVGGDANAGGYLFGDAGGNLALANATAGESVDLIAGGTINGGNLTAGDSVIARSNGAVTLGNLSAGIVNPSSEPVDGYTVGIGSLTSIAVGNVQAAGFAGFASDGSLVAGAVQSGGDVMALVDGPATIGSITTGAQGRAYIAGFGMLAVGGGFEDFDPVPVYAAANPVPTAGNVTISGATQTSRLDAFVGGNFSAGAVTAGAINGRVGGLATINGIWSSPSIELWSNDLDIGASGGMDGGTQGLIRLVSTNTTQALIGDGLTGTGYALSNAEFGRLSSGNVRILARGDASAAIDMLIGDLNVTGPLAGSTVEAPSGSLIFATGNPSTEVAGGVIRIVGDLKATGFNDSNSLEFYADRFELDAATGLLEITGNGTTLSGELYIEADRIHVASGTILDQLAANPQYEGYQDDLNAPAEVQRPDGVIRAGGIDVFPTQAVLVQNTGTAQTPAGFLTFGEGPLFSQSEAPTGPIELIINGQLMTDNGLLSGVDVRDFLIDESNIGIFTANSTINGCPLTGACLGGFPPGFTPLPGLPEEFELFDNDLLPPPDFGNEDFIDDNDEETEEGATSPIKPPKPLFDTSALGDPAGATGPGTGTSMRSNPGLIETGDVDDPVSGSGNPALMETPPTPPTNEEKQP